MLPFPVDGLTDGVDDAAEHDVTDRDLEDFTGTPDRVTFFDMGEITEQDDADAVCLEVEDHPVDGILSIPDGGEGEHFLGHAAGQAADLCDTVSGFDDFPDLFRVELGVEAGEGLGKDFRDLFRIDGEFGHDYRISGNGKGRNGVFSPRRLGGSRCAVGPVFVANSRR